MELLKGKPVAQKLYQEIKEKFSHLKPKVAIVVATKDESSLTYLRSKVKRMNKYGIEVEVLELDESISQDEFLNHIKRLNDDDSIDGIFVEMPLPPQIDTYAVASTICPKKDIEGISPWNLGKIFYGRDELAPSTASAVIQILEHYGIEIRGKRAVVMGRSVVVGKPVAMMLTNKHATTTVIHSKTPNPEEITRQADILVVAIGRAKHVKKHMVKEGAVIIDVGINVVDDSIVGDVDCEDVREVAAAITPVPGGVGTVTTAITLYRAFYLKWLKEKGEL